MTLTPYKIGHRIITVLEKGRKLPKTGGDFCEFII